MLVRRVLAPALLGVLLGLFSARGDGVQVVVVNGLANAASPWIVVAFGVGAIAAAPRTGAFAGALALLAAVATYYIGFLAGGAGFLLPFLAVWAVAAVLCGGLLGAAGGAWAAERSRWGPVAVSLVSGLLLAEACHRLILLQVWTGIEWNRTYMQVAVADAIGAVLVPLLLLDRSRWMTAAAFSLAVALMGVGLLSAGDAVLGLAAGVAR
jgi:hypothetical protein